MARLDGNPEPTAADGWSPNLGGAEQINLPRIPPGPPWLYAHHPNRWTVDEEAGEVLPDLTTLSGEPGVNNTGKEVKGGGGDLSGAILKAQQRGFTVFTSTAIPGVGASYIRPVTTRGGVCYLPYPAEAIAGTAVIRVDADRNREMLKAFKAAYKLVPPVHVLEAMLERLKVQHARASVTADRDPLKAELAEQYAARIKVLKDTLNPPKPARKRAPKAGE